MNTPISAIYQALRFHFGCTYAQIAAATRRSRRSAWNGTNAMCGIRKWQDRNYTARQQAITAAGKLLEVYHHEQDARKKELYRLYCIPRTTGLNAKMCLVIAKNWLRSCPDTSRIQIVSEQK